MITEYGNYISNDPNYKYEDGIMNYELFKNEKIKILWILRETHGRFNPKGWWGEKKYYNEKINPFARKNKDGKIEKNSKGHTYRPIAKICYQILNAKKTRNAYELATALERVAIINLKKTPGPETKSEEYEEELKNLKNRDIFVYQIKRIKPDVIICGNTLNDIKTSEINFRKGIEKSFSNSVMANNHYFCFKNIVFINAYHPSKPTKKYVSTIIEAYQYWINNKDIENWPVFNWE